MAIFGIDNGVSGSIGIIGETGGVKYLHMPIRRVLEYTKGVRWVNRIDVPKLHDILVQTVEDQMNAIVLERPLVHPGMFRATMSAMRALEATLIVIEMVGYRYCYIDSKEWQKVLLPHGLKGGELKVASKSVAARLFPKIDLTGFPDADGLLIAEYYSRNWKNMKFEHDMQMDVGNEKGKKQDKDSGNV